MAAETTIHGTTKIKVLSRIQTSDGCPRGYAVLTIQFCEGDNILHECVTYAPDGQKLMPFEHGAPR